MCIQHTIESNNMIPKLIFLDVDGVLNHELFYVEKDQQQRADEVGYPQSEFDPNTIKIVNSIVEQTGAKIVISSCWRNNRTIEELKELFKSVGLNEETIIGKTPNLAVYDLATKKRTHLSTPRGCEIEEYLEINYGYKADVKYVILDDDADMLLHQQKHFVWIDSYAGLTEAHVQTILKILE